MGAVFSLASGTVEFTMHDGAPRGGGRRHAGDVRVATTLIVVALAVKLAGDARLRLARWTDVVRRANMHPRSIPTEPTQGESR
jgi:hypothetical protein